MNYLLSLKLIVVFLLKVNAFLMCTYLISSANEYENFPFDKGDSSTRLLEHDLPQVLLDYFIFPFDEDVTSINLGIHVAAG